MQRSKKSAWLEGPGDLREADVEDVPVPGESVRVRGLPAKYSAEVQGQMRVVQEGRDQVAKIDVPSMELLQFVHGVIDPVFTQEEAAVIQERFGPSFRKIIGVIDELSGIDKEAISDVEARFRSGGTDTGGSDVGDEVAAGGNGSDLPVRTGTGTRDADQ